MGEPEKVAVADDRSVGRPWAVADAISDGVVGLLNQHKGERPVQLLAGLLLGYLALESTMPPDPPEEIRVLTVAVRRALDAAMARGAG